MNSSVWKDMGYLLLRVGLGLLMVRHGWPKISQGPERWEKLGGVMAEVFDISFLPVAWGFLASVSEFVGGLCVAAGILFRPACLLIVLTMLVAFLSHLHDGDDFGGWVEAAEMGLAFLAMFMMGPGKYSLHVALKK